MYQTTSYPYRRYPNRTYQGTYPRRRVFAPGASPSTAPPIYPPVGSHASATSEAPGVPPQGSHYLPEILDLLLLELEILTELRTDVSQVLSNTSVPKVSVESPVTCTGRDTSVLDMWSDSQELSPCSTPPLSTSNPDEAPKIKPLHTLAKKGVLLPGSQSGRKRLAEVLGQTSLTSKKRSKTSLLGRLSSMNTLEASSATALASLVSDSQLSRPEIGLQMSGSSQDHQE